MTRTTTRPTRIKYRIEAMDCPTEEAMIRGKLAPMAGVAGLEFNLIQRVLTVEHTHDDGNQIEAAIKSLGFEPVLEGGGPAVAPVNVAADGLQKWWPLGLALILAVAAEVVDLLAVWTPWLPAGLAALAIGLSGLTTYRKGWTAVINLNLNINALMSLAVTGAFLLQQWPEAAMVMVLFAVAEKIEALSLDRARRAIDGLMTLTPDQATVQQADGTWAVTEAAAVAVGSLVRVRPGERLSHDGTVVMGTTSIDQAPITGESLPADKGPGDPVFAGTVNQHGEIVVKVGSEAKASTLARIIHLVEEAQSHRSPTQRFVDRFAQIYTPLVFGLAVLIGVLPPLVAGGSWYEWIYKALVILVIACPCALVVSTPVTIVSALARAARLGIIVKGGAALEQMRRLSYLAFDKTGTITWGRPTQTDYLELAAPLVDLRQLAVSLACRSDHPVSQALARHGQEEGIEPLSCDNFQALPGRGSRASLGGQTWYLGNHRLIEELGLCSSELEAQLEALEAQGKTAVVLASEFQAWAVFAVADTVKPTSLTAVADLHRLGIKTLMLSGDNPRTAAVIAQQVQIDEVRGNLLPEDKAKALHDLGHRGQITGMVGDGINDAPALAQAHIGLAMGLGGTDAVIETADVVLMDEDLRKVPQLVRLSRRTVAVLGQNIAIAVGLKAAFLILTLLGWGTMWMAVFADMGASLIVVFNGLRLMGNRRRG